MWYQPARGLVIPIHDLRQSSSFWCVSLFAVCGEHSVPFNLLALQILASAISSAL